MNDVTVGITYIGGPTALLELGGARLLTDPTFDPGGGEYTTPVYTLYKTLGPAVAADTIGHIDAVLLSHDHHFDNLDRAGRSLMSRAGAVITTPAGAKSNWATGDRARDVDVDRHSNGAGPAADHEHAGPARPA